MKVIISPSKLDGCVEAPPSKSCMHRALICAAAADRPTKIVCNSFSKDIEATINCLSALGAGFEYDDNSVTVYPVCLDDDMHECELHCNESGSTLRFMLPFAAALGKNCVFTGAERLGERPLLPLCDALTSHGVNVKWEKTFLPCKTEGKLHGGVFEIPGDISSQFITGLLLALGVAGGGEIKTTTPLKSGPYIDITVDMLRTFGIEARKTDTGYIIPGGQKYISPEELIIEGDYSNGAFWLVAGAIGSENYITCSSLKEESFQGDSKIVEILKSMGADISRNKDSITVRKSQLKGVCIDCSDIPDIVPILCVAATQAEGKTVFKNIERLRAKESDRVQTTADMLQGLGGKVSFDENTMIVEKSTLTGGEVTSANDHRIAMSAAIASLLCSSDVIIDSAEAVEKSYPDFYEKFTMLGGKYK
ncbi:MAG: 3-phosphoshikimate 1-carboxyvinyltransferase [Ruminococcaceae bacterium]|nr:3-phosphoshikimate 1-carboxyvinyltransferase [Oscillospiraceae bacterium]